MQRHLNLFYRIYHRYLYSFPLRSAVLLSIISSLYLIANSDVINRSALPLLWRIKTGQPPEKPLEYLIGLSAQLTGLATLDASYLLMIIAHAIIIILLVLIAKRLGLSLFSQWLLVFLLLCHPTYNDFRIYILLEPIFWCLWLLAVYLLISYYRSHSVIAILAWLSIFIISTSLMIAGWFWLLLFPFGALFWKPWRRKSVIYALLAYAFITFLLLLLPTHNHTASIRWLINTVITHPDRLSAILSLHKSNWVNEENSLLAGVFVFSGATSLVLVRSIIAFGLIPASLTIYAFGKKQVLIIPQEQRRMLIYIIGFDIFISVVLFILNEDSGSVVSFSLSLILLLFAALGLSFVIKKITAAHYPKVVTLVIMWCLVGYFASAYIRFGPQKDYLREAGQRFAQQSTIDLRSNNAFLLFYADENPSNTLSWPQADLMRRSGQRFFYAYDKNRNSPLPESLKALSPTQRFSNRRGDQLLIYQFAQGKAVQSK